MDVTFIPVARQAGAEVRSECFVTGIERDNTGRVSGVVYVQNGVEQRQPCRHVFLCAGAVETPRLLLLNGLANGSGQVGRNFLAHVGTQVWGQFAEDIRPYKGIPGGLISEDTHRPQNADFASGYLLQSIGVMPVTYASQAARGDGLWGERLREHMRGYNHVAGINICGDCLPSESNFLELSEETRCAGTAQAARSLHGGRERAAHGGPCRNADAGHLGGGRSVRCLGVGPPRAHAGNVPDGSRPVGLGGRRRTAGRMTFPAFLL